MVYNKVTYIDKEKIKRLEAELEKTTLYAIESNVDMDFRLATLEINAMKG